MMQTDLKLAVVSKNNILTTGISKLMSDVQNQPLSLICRSNDECLNFNPKNIDIVLVDKTFEDDAGLVVARKIKNKYRNLSVAIICGKEHVFEIKESLQNDLDGYFCVDVEEKDLIKGLYSIKNGDKYYCKSSNRILLKGIINKRMPIESYYKQLTNREKEVARLILNGCSRSEISDKLNISVRTVDTHRTNIIEKLGFKNTVEMINKLISADLS